VNGLRFRLCCKAESKSQEDSDRGGGLPDLSQFEEDSGSNKENNDEKGGDDGNGTGPISPSQMRLSFCLYG
jgi:hypothetical protein